MNERRHSDEPLSTKEQREFQRLMGGVELRVKNRNQELPNRNRPSSPLTMGEPKDFHVQRELLEQLRENQKRMQRASDLYNQLDQILTAPQAKQLPLQGRRRKTTIAVPTTSMTSFLADLTVDARREHEQFTLTFYDQEALMTGCIIVPRQGWITGFAEDIDSIGAGYEQGPPIKSGEPIEEIATTLVSRLLAERINPNQAS